MFLTDERIQALLETSPEILDGLELGEWQPLTKESPIQAASVDLHIGGIFVPGSTPGALGSSASPRTDLALGAGATAVVSTHETCRFPESIGAICFPPARVSSKGLLTTNPGHVDPGFKGRLSFTVINMGREPYALKAGDAIVTLLLFELSPSAALGYSQRRSGAVRDKPVNDELLNRLSHDFLDVTKRAESAAKTEEHRARRWALIAGAIPTSLTLILAVVGLWAPWRSDTDDKITSLEQKVAVLEAESSDAELRAQLSDLLKRVETLERTSTRSEGGP
jgi:dCTP deaminase